MLKRISDKQLVEITMPRRWIEYWQGLERGDEKLPIKLEQEIADAQLSADKEYLIEWLTAHGNKPLMDEFLKEMG